MKALKHYTLASCEQLIYKYLHDFGGNIMEINEGCLGLGTILLYGAEGKKSYLINEVYVSAWNSSHTVKTYNKLPKKYLKLIESFE